MKKSDYKKLIKKQQESGLSVKDFCFNQGVSPATFYRWKKIIHSKDNPRGFIPLVLSNNKIGKVIPDHFPIQKDEEGIAKDIMEFTFPNGTQLKLTGSIDISMLKAIVHLY